MIIKTGNKNHDDACLSAEMTRQAAVVPGASQAVVKAAELAFFRSVISSAKANGLPIPVPAIDALMSLGVRE
jgi:hypothetical protein